MALVKLKSGFAIEFDCTLMEGKEARMMDTAAYYNIFFKTILEAIAAAALDEGEHRGHLIYELTRVLEAALPDEVQTEIMFAGIAPEEQFAYKKIA